MKHIKVLVLTAVAALLACPAWSAELAGYWSFDENQGTVAKTSAVSGYNGEIHGASWVPGKAGSALKFNGESDYVEIKDEAAGSPFALKSMTISAWVKPEAYPAKAPVWWGGIAGKAYSGESTYGLRLGYNGSIYFHVHGPFGEGGKLAAFDCRGKKDKEVVLNEWSHVVVTYDNKEVKIYLNGRLDSTYEETRLPQINRQSIFIGSTNGKSRYFKGIIDEVKIYKGALTYEEVEAEYKKGGGAAGVTSGNLPRINEAPSLDGALFDSCWQRALKVDFVDTAIGASPKAVTTGYMCYDDKNLYIAFACKEPFMDRIKASATERDGVIWNDDCVEAFIDPGLSRKNYYHFMITSKNVQFDGKCSGPGSNSEDTGWDGKWQSSTALQPDGWTAEMQIPLSNFALASDVGSSWGINLCRERKPEPENTAWAPTFGAFHSPEKFAILWRFNADFDPYKTEVSAPVLSYAFKSDKPLLQLIQSFVNSSASAKQVNIKIQSLSGKENISRNITLLPGKAQEVTLPVSVSKNGNLYKFRTEITDSKAGLTYNAVTAAKCPAIMSSYFDRAYYTTESAAHLTGNININGKLPKGLRARVLLQLQGKTVAEKTAPVSSARFSIPVEISSLPAGKYDATVSVSQDSDTLYAESMRLSKYPPSNRTINVDRKNLCMLVDGKPFFPIGMIGIPNVSIPEYADAGFNINMNCNPDIAYYNGMMTVSASFYAVPKAHYSSLAPDALEDELRNKGKSRFTTMVERDKNYPALAGHFWDEPMPNEVKGVEVLSKLTRELDPYHLIIPCFYQDSGPTMQPGLYDLCVADLYWFKAPKTTRFERCDAIDTYVHEAQDVAHMPLWFMPEAAGWDSASAITPAEQRVQTYLPLIHGARGIFYWSHMQVYPAMAAELKKLGRELKELTPVLLTLRPEQTVTGADDATVHALAKMYNGDFYLLTANNSADEEKTIRIKVSSAVKAKEAKVLFENRTVPVNGGVLEDKFSPYATHVYVLEKADTRQPVQIAIEKLASAKVPIPKVRRWPDANILDEGMRWPDPDIIDARMVNPGFEDAEDGQPRIWTPSCGWEAPEYCALSTKEFHGGSKSLKLCIPKTTCYSPETGFGWSAESKVTAIDLGKLRPTCRYANRVTTGIFKVDLPDGKYSVKVTANTSDLFEMKGNTRVKLAVKTVETPVPQGIVSTIKENTFDVTVEGGQLNLSVPYATIYSLHITPKSGGKAQAFDFGPYGTPVTAGHKLVSASELASIDVMSRNNDWQPVIRLKPDVKYKLSIYMKSDTPNLPVTFGANIGEKKPGIEDSITVSVGTEWKKYEMPVTKKGSSAWSLVKFNSPGTLWVDDFTLEKQ